MLGGQVIVDIIICHQIIGNTGNQTVKIYNLSLEVHKPLTRILRVEFIHISEPSADKLYIP